MRLSKGRENYGYFLMWISFQKWSVWSRAVDPTIRRNFGQRGQRDECDDGHFYRSTSGHLRIQFSRFDKRWNSYLHQNHAQWAKCGRGLSSSRRRGWWKSYLSGNLKKIHNEAGNNEKSFQSEALEKAEGMLTQSVVVQVEENDQVSVFAYHGNIRDGGWHYTHFNGYLIS